MLRNHFVTLPGSLQAIKKAKGGVLYMASSTSATEQNQAKHP